MLDKLGGGVTIFPIEKNNKKKYLYQMAFFAEFEQYFNVTSYFTNLSHSEKIFDINMAVFPIKYDYDKYFQNIIKSSERALIRKSIKNNFYCKKINYDEYLKDIYEINTSKNERQNEKMSNDYINLKPREKIVKNVGQEIYTFGCFSSDNKLVAYYMFELFGKNILHTVKGIGHSEYLSYGIMNALFAYSVSELYKIYPSGNNYILYGGMDLNGDGLSRFKKNIGCQQNKIKIKSSRQFFKDLKYFNQKYIIHGDTGLNFVLDYM